MKSILLLRSTKILILVFVALIPICKAQLTLIDRQEITNNRLSIEISGSGSLNLLAMQGSFRFDSKSLSFDQVEILAFPTLVAQDFSVENNTSVNLVWIDPELTGKQLPANTPLFKLHFTILNNLNNEVSFSNCPLGIEVIGANDAVIPVTGNIVADKLCTVIRGTVYQDLDRNCRGASSDRKFGNVMLEVNGPGGSRYIMTDALGQYRVIGVPGEYTVKVIPPHAFWNPCEQQATIRVTNINNPRTHDFFLSPTVDCPTLEVRAGASQLRPCTREYVYVHYRNAGTIAAQNSDLEVRMDPRFNIINVDKPFTITPPGILFISVGDLAPGESGVARITVDIPCNGIPDGASFCIRTVGRPGATCLPPGPNWSGANLQVSAACQNGNAILRATNVGNSNMTTPARFLIFENDGLSATEFRMLNAGQSFTWETQGTGKTYSILSDQVIGFPVQGPISSSIEGCGSTSVISTGFINQFPRQQAAFADHHICIPVENKTNAGSATMWNHLEGYGPNNEVRKDVKLDYIITSSGPGTSINSLLIIDTLQNYVDLSSFRIEASSHPVEISWTGKNIVNFLVDLSSEPVSQNEFIFINYSIRINQNIELPFIATNRATVFRAVNSAVVTNSVQHTIVDQYDDFIMTSITESGKDFNQIATVFPNPANYSIFIEILDKNDKGTWQAQIIDLTGKTLLSAFLNNHINELSTIAMPAGLYLIRLSNLATKETLYSKMSIVK
jgi:hypothetical protein